MNYNTVSAALVAVPNRSIMRISHFFVLTVLISTALAWPRQRQSALTMEEGALEEALSRRGYAHSNARRPNAWGQQSGLGLVEGVCKSVKADTSFLGTTTQNNLVHFCEEPSGVCYYTSMMECCNTLQSGGIEVSGGADFVLGSTNVRVRFLRAGGFGSPLPDSASICYLVPDDRIQVCEALVDCVPDGCADSEVCTNNAVDPACDLVTGCVCKRGYLPPICCLCDGPDFIRNPVTEQCDEICLPNCLRPINNGTDGCSLCLPGFVLENRGCCNCRSDLEQMGNRCVCQRPDQRLNENEECECPPGTIDVDGECTEICDENCVNGHFSETTGCSLCKVGFKTAPLCCDCIGDRIGPDCRCPSDKVENPDTGECEPCPGDLVPVNGECVCTGTTIRSGINCINCPPPRMIIDGECEIPPPECGKNQDIIFVQDNTQSFKPTYFIPIMQAMEIITSALKAQASNGVNVATVLYPVYRNNELRTAARILFGLSTACSTAVRELNQLAFNIYSSQHQSETTRSFEALEFVESSMILSMIQPTTVLTITDDASDDTDAISRINETVRKIQHIRPKTRFYSAGLEISQDDDFEEEIAALGENIPSHTVISSADSIRAFTESVIDLLVNASVLCPEQRTEILAAINDASTTYIDCVDGSYNGRGFRIEDCVDVATLCPTLAESEESLVDRIMEAVKQALKQG